MEDKLIELINNACDGHVQNLQQPYEAEALAKYLIDNGVIVLPCKMGDTVWFIKSAFSYSKHPLSEKVRKIEIVHDEIFVRTENKMFSPKHINKTVFISQKEAEQTLKKMQEELNNA